MPFLLSINRSAAYEAGRSGVSDSGEAEDAEMTSETTGDWSAEKINSMIKWCKTSFADHPTFELPNADQIMRSSIEDCFGFAGSSARFHEVMNWALSDVNKDDSALDKQRRSVATSRLLGGFLKKVFPSWVTEYDRAVADGAYTSGAFAFRPRLRP